VSNAHRPPRFSVDIDRAAIALRAESKELSSVLTHLRTRMGVNAPRSTYARQVTMRLTFAHGRQSWLSSSDRTALFRLAHVASLKKPTVVSTAGGARIAFSEEYPPPLAQLPPKVRAHAEGLEYALSGHHERAISLFKLLAEHHLGTDLNCSVDRPQLASSPATLLRQDELDKGMIEYPTVPALELTPYDLA
jgi:hypothetical protein